MYNFEYSNQPEMIQRSKDGNVLSRSLSGPLCYDTVPESYLIYFSHSIVQKETNPFEVFRCFACSTIIMSLTKRFCWK